MIENIKKVWRFVKRPLWRTIIGGIVFLIICVALYFLWDPGIAVIDGRYDLGKNGIWIQHGWLGSDEWFKRNGKLDKKSEFRLRDRIKSLSLTLKQNNILYIYPHLCPALPNGNLPDLNEEQCERFLDICKDFNVLPWIGGIQERTVFCENEKWRVAFADSIKRMLTTFPRFKGVHINVEPCRNGDEAFLRLLKEVKVVLPRDKILSVAAYPPPTYWHPFPEVHWEEKYFRKISNMCDQMVVMMYDTSLKKEKIYRALMANWTKDVLHWGESTEILLGIPVYNDKGVKYHYSEVENLENAILGINSGLRELKDLPGNYTGLSIYCNWEMDPKEWEYWGKNFMGKK